MQLTLSTDEARMLRDALNAYLPGLRRETAATDLGSRDLRHMLQARETFCEKLLADLEKQLGSSGG